MPCRKIFVIKIFIALAFVVLLSFSGTAGAAEPVRRVEEFLKRSALSVLSEAERADVLEAVRTAPSRTQWLMSGGGQVYALVAVPAQKDSRPNVQIRLEEAARTRASLRAHYLLYLRAMPAARKARYENEESAAEALAEWDSGRQEGERLKADVSIAAVSEGWAFALLRTSGELLNSLGAQIQNLPHPALDTAYCAALYPKAKSLFDQKKYGEALPAYRELHRLSWARPAAYLDAAECFLHTGDKKSASRLTEETVTELADAMNDALLQRAGDIFLESGEEVRAEQTYRLALDKLRSEPTSHE